jgi:hypothetical protein
MAMTRQQLDTFKTNAIDGMPRRMTERDFPGEQVTATAAALYLMKTITLKPLSPPGGRDSPGDRRGFGLTRRVSDSGDSAGAARFAYADDARLPRCCQA